MNSRIDDLNYYRDQRTHQTPDLKDYPTHWEICHVCQGEGRTVNPSIDAGGISAEAFNDDPDFAEAYMNGTYDVPCNYCSGSGKVKGIDYNNMTPEMQEEYDIDRQVEAEMHAERMGEIMMGA